MRELWNDSTGLEAVEYIVLGAILLMLLALAFVALFNTIQTKLLSINSSL